MSELVDLFEAGDLLLTRDHRGQVYVWSVNEDGWLNLRQSPLINAEEAKELRADD